MSLVSGWCNGQVPKHKECRDAGCTCTCHGESAPTHVVGPVEVVVPPGAASGWGWTCSCGETGFHHEIRYARIQRTAHLKRNPS